jgi:hypothetical protein
MDHKAPAAAASGWLVERNFLGHNEGWWLDSFCTTEEGARDHVRQLRASVAKRGYRLRARADA